MPIRTSGFDAPAPHLLGVAPIFDRPIVAFDFEIIPDPDISGPTWLGTEEV